MRAILVVRWSLVDHCRQLENRTPPLSIFIPGTTAQLQGDEMIRGRGHLSSSSRSAQLGDLAVGEGHEERIHLLLADVLKSRRVPLRLAVLVDEHWKG